MHNEAECEGRNDDLWGMFPMGKDQHWAPVRNPAIVSACTIEKDIYLYT